MFSIWYLEEVDEVIWVTCQGKSHAIDAFNVLSAFCIDKSALSSSLDPYIKMFLAWLCVT